MNILYVIDLFLFFYKEVNDPDSSLCMDLLEIQSLFTNMLLEETINICVDQAFQNNKKVNKLLKRHFRQLATLTAKFFCFLFSPYLLQTNKLTVQLYVLPQDPHFSTYFLFIMDTNAQRIVPFRLNLNFIVAMLMIYSFAMLIIYSNIQFDKKNHNWKVL